MLNDPRLTREQRANLEKEFLDPASLPSQSLAHIEEQLSPMPPGIKLFWQTPPRSTLPAALIPEMHAHTSQQGQVVDEFIAALASVLSAKQGAALQESAWMVAGWHPRSREFRKTITCLQQAMTEVFPRLAVEQQLDLLRNDSARIWVTPEIAHYLEDLYDRESAHIGAAEKAAIIRDLNWVDSAAARALVIHEASSDSPGVSTEGLGILTDESLPELDGILMRRLTKNYESDFWGEYQVDLRLVERYASPSVLAEMRKLYEEENDWYYQDRALFLSYFLRVAPDYGLKMIRRALNDPRNAERDTLLTDVMNARSKLANEPMARQVAARLEPIAEQMITAKDGDIAGDAGFVVQEFAKSDFEPVLWHELQTWCDRWCETPMQNVPISESSRRDGLVMALLYNRSWIMTPEKLRRIRSLARVKDSAVAAVHDMNSPEAPIHVGAVKDLGSVQIRIMYYSYSSLDLALNHLRLLPKETFVWDAYLSDPNDPDIKAVLTAVKSAILANGGVLTGEPNSQ